jgi:putative oxidoreductase
MSSSPSGNNTLLRVISHVFALAVAVFFLYAAWNKIGPDNARQFAIEIGNYKILASQYTNIPAIILPWVEVFAAIALIFPATRKAGSILIGGMLLFFIGAVFYSAIILGLKISCGCTGAGSGAAGWLTIGRNLLLLTGVVLSNVLCRPKSASADSPEF